MTQTCQDNKQVSCVRLTALENGSLYHHVEKDSGSVRKKKDYNELVVSLKGGKWSKWRPTCSMVGIPSQESDQDFMSKSFPYTNQLG